MKRVTFLIEDSFYKDAKIKAVMNDITMTEYIVGIIKKDLAESENKNAEIKN